MIQKYDNFYLFNSNTEKLYYILSLFIYLEKHLKIHVRRYQK